VYVELDVFCQLLAGGVCVYRVCVKCVFGGDVQGVSRCDV